MEKPLKLLVRSWIQGKGCIHQRSAAMSEAEARELLEVGRDAIDKAQESGGIEQIPLVKGRAYVKARRTPDPDEPRRTAPGFVLVSIPDPDAFIRVVVVREFDELLRSAAEATLDQTPSPGEGNLGQRGWRIIDLGRPPAVLTTKTRSWAGTRQKLSLIALIVGLVAVYLLSQRTWQSLPSEAGHTQGQVDRENHGSDPQESTWKEVQEQIKQALKADWAKKPIDHETPTSDTNRDLLRRFAELFRRPDLNKVLTGKEFRCYEVQDPPNHPFVAFLSHLPESIPALQVGEADLTPTESMQYMNKINDELNKSKPFCIDLELDKPRRLVDKVKLNLNYLDFFKKVLSAIPSDALYHGNWRKDDPLDKSRDDDGAYLWVKPIRKLIESGYPWR